MELALGLTALQPVERHVHGFGVSWLYVIVHDSKGCGIVGLHGSLGLFVAHFRKCYSWNGLLCIDVECIVFNFVVLFESPDGLHDVFLSNVFDA
jgi:hypothetical protein